LIPLHRVLGEGDKRMAAASLDGRVAIVTGAAGGIGRAYCLALGSRGCAMVAADVADSQPVANEIIAAGGRAIAVRTDVSDQQSTKEMASAALGSFGRV